MWTLDEGTRRRYVQGMTRLGTWYVRTLLERGEIRPETLVTALSRRVDLFRFTNLWNGTNEAEDGLANPAWVQMAEQIAAEMRRVPMAEVGALEEHVLALLQPTMEKRLPKDVGPPPQRPFACWTYELGWVGLADGPGLLGKLRNRTHVAATLRQALGRPPAPSPDAVLHIMNVMVPQSPFDDMPRLAGTLRALIGEIRVRQPQVRALWCNTWLNEHPRFHELLPESWFRNGVVAPPGNYRNWWGQFARRDGDFNEAAGAQFRQAGGVFRFRALQCHAGLEEIDAHLRGRFGL